MVYDFLDILIKYHCTNKCFSTFISVSLAAVSAGTVLGQYYFDIL